VDSVDNLKANLESQIKELDLHFIDSWIPAKPGDEPNDYQYDVKAYCVLAHAAFEEYVEDISLFGLNKAYDSWVGKIYSKATVCLLLFYNQKLEVNDDELSKQDKIFDLVREKINESKSNHSIAIQGNHGFSLKYLRKLFTPIGVDIPDTPNIIESLKKLTSARGSYAHSQAKHATYGAWKKLKNPMSPEDARLIVEDCLKLCRDIGEDVKNL
jgi:hypothetical protein